MSTLAYAVADSATMLRRNLKHLLRYPSLTLMLAGMPDRLPAAVRLRLRRHARRRPRRTPGRAAATATSTTSRPASSLMAVAAAAQGTAIAVATDMTEGIIDRFRTMAISRAAVLTGHVVGSLIQTLLALALVIGVAVAIGFRPDADAARLARPRSASSLLFAFALIWLSVALGLAAKTVESASNTPHALMLLPFLGSAFVPTDTMPPGLRWFAEYQPFTPVTETLRGLLAGARSAPTPSPLSPGASASRSPLPVGAQPLRPASSSRPELSCRRRARRSELLDEHVFFRCARPQPEHARRTFSASSAVDEHGHVPARLVRRCGEEGGVAASRAVQAPGIVVAELAEVVA